MPDLNQYTEELFEFVAARGWDRRQNPKDLAMALGGEAGELLALMRWVTPEAARARALDDSVFRRQLSAELADILNYLLRLSRSAGIDLIAAARERLADDELRHPVGADRGDGHGDPHGYSHGYGRLASGGGSW